MKIMKSTVDNTVICAHEDHVQINMEEYCFVVNGDVIKTYYMDRNASNAEVVENVNIPDDYAPFKYKYAAGVWNHV